MLRSLKKLEGYAVHATDGEIGVVTNLLLDDQHWGVRYLVVKTGGFLNERSVLISPSAFRHVDDNKRQFHLALSVYKVKNSPNINLDRPVSRQQEEAHHDYYGYGYYWGYPGTWSIGTEPAMLGASNVLAPPATAPDTATSGHAQDTHLRSASELRGYHIQGSDGDIGHIADFMADDEAWIVRYLVINTSNWWVGKEVLVAPYWASQVSWAEHKVHLAMSRQEIKASPQWDPTSAISRAFETRLHDHYGRPGYWASAPVVGDPASWESKGSRGQHGGHLG